MDITSPSSLWKDYDVAALPLNESALSEKNVDGITVKEYYFDGYATVDGRVRAFLKIYERQDAKGTILYLPNSDGSVNDKIVFDMNNYGFNVAALDYVGVVDGGERSTLYPKSLSDCNCHGVDVFTIGADAQYSNWYIWVCMARRAALLVKKFYSHNIYALGVGLGGSTVYKLAAFDGEFTACATLLNIIPKVSGDGNHLINYHASLENSAYAPFCKIPLFIAVCSNDEDGSLDDMSDLANSTASVTCFRIIELDRRRHDRAARY